MPGSYTPHIYVYTHKQHTSCPSSSFWVESNKLWAHVHTCTYTHLHSQSLTITHTDTHCITNARTSTYTHAPHMKACTHTNTHAHTRRGHPPIYHCKKGTTSCIPCLHTWSNPSLELCPKDDTKHHWTPDSLGRSHPTPVDPCNHWPKHNVRHRTGCLSTTLPPWRNGNNKQSQSIIINNNKWSHQCSNMNVPNWSQPHLWNWSVVTVIFPKTHWTKWPRRS